jgi:hypothetical protein
MTMRQVVYLQDAIGLRKKAVDRWAQLSPLQRVPVVLTANAIVATLAWIGMSLFLPSTETPELIRFWTNHDLGCRRGSSKGDRPPFPPPSTVIEEPSGVTSGGHAEMICFCAEDRSRTRPGPSAVSCSLDDGARCGRIAAETGGPWCARRHLHRNHLISVVFLVGAQGLEPWTR